MKAPFRPNNLSVLKLHMDALLSALGLPEDGPKSSRPGSWCEELSMPRFNLRSSAAKSDGAQHAEECDDRKDRYLSFTFAHVSRNVTVRLKTSASGRESIGSLMK